MSILNWFRTGKPAPKTTPEMDPLTQEEFSNALLSLAQHDSMETEDVIADMVKRGIKEDRALALYLFVPIAFCRRFIPEAQYLDEYVEYDAARKKEVKMSFKANHFYAEIERYTLAYFTQNPERNVVLTVAGCSAEFKAINQALDNGSQIEDLEFAPLFIVR
ncbi:hypothetical protein LGH70_19340 [Hymenobacter sp. BT635]|uniref:Uncharacterized protein n=1 Tax=Hymenobacter nitidus TaxID=2880929 RepID=A0ABS8AJR7_9BACT|nr:hypothetical protein [Hymenobacter nitidus]MCB2379759.1 hypothetical protein [Hymenobacter nitidus]